MEEENEREKTRREKKKKIFISANKAPGWPNHLMFAVC
jgi:hypothetical protein